MIDALKTRLPDDLKYIPIENDESLEKIYHLFENKVKFRASSTEELFWYGRYYDCKKDYDEAKHFYKYAAEGDYNPAICALGYLYQTRIKNRTKMMKYYQLGIDKCHSPSAYNLAKYYLDKGELDEAYTILSQALDWENNAGVYFNVGAYYGMKKDYDKCIEYMELVLEKQDEERITRLCYQNLGACHLKKGNIDKGIEYLVKAKNIKPTTSVLHSLARIYQKTGDQQKMFECYQELANMNDVDGLYMMMEISEQLGNKDETAFYAGKYLRQSGIDLFNLIKKKLMN